MMEDGIDRGWERIRAGRGDPPRRSEFVREEWFTACEAARTLQLSLRQTRRMLADVAEDLLQEIPNPRGRGRPVHLYHYMVHPALRAWFELRNGAAADPAGDPADPAKPGVAADDLAIARLRARAVQEYRHNRRFLPESAAAWETCAAWARRPRSETVITQERLPDGHTRESRKTVSVGGFGKTTLRGWSALYKDSNENILSLAPAWKGARGPDPIPIPHELLDLVHALSVSTARADVVRAVGRARRQWPGSFPEISISTWRRRIKARDADGACRTLGKLGIAAFRRTHSPDIERDYTRNADGTPFRFNQAWQLDDATLDFYGHGFDPNQLIRPFTYKIIRVSTRQWICSVACETPITQDQVRSILGLAMAQRSGGIPEEILFERGAVACDEYLERLLRDLGVAVHRTSMDGGTTHPGAIPDRPTGHWQGKLIEANIRRSHALMWDAPLQTGPEERHTAHASLENAKREAVRRLEAGEQLITFRPEQWAGYVRHKDEEANNTPHSGLPQILVNAGTNERRHMTPNEYAAHLVNSESGKPQITVLSAALLPLFFQKGFEILVGRNGVIVNRHSYGRFDDGLQALAGKPVRVFALKEYPDVVYVEQLGRCVERYERAGYGGAPQIEAKRAIERAKRNKYEDLMVRAAATGQTLTAEAVMFTADTVPADARSEFAPAALLQRANALAANESDQAEKREASARRFDVDLKSEISNSPRGRGLIATAADVRDQIAALGGDGGAQ